MKSAAWYVHGVRQDFPHAEAWLSGPHDDLADAGRAAARLRPYYPEATLSPRKRVGLGLPECRPARPAVDLKTAGGRAAAGHMIAERLRDLGLEAVVENWDGDPDVTCITPSLRAGIWLAWTPLAPMPIINWYSAARPLVAVPGAWPAEFNAQRTKATSAPRDWPELFEMLEIGLLASIDGSAFE